jgi:hypothetical protein
MSDEDVWNTICPVCGSPIDPKMALIDVAHASEGHQHQDQPQRGMRLCSKKCAEIAGRVPEKYRLAATANKIADDALPSAEPRHP